ncbi:MAG: UDP-N-acetylmuramoyl-tripeptide--D-alanyl-D-alanine ligase [Limnochordales bacterium]|nr:UDP-N-acetylmuramoyl-tripeptide--D-alanyl-D-alanine ligase [Limnochordales bacterium]
MEPLPVEAVAQAVGGTIAAGDPRAVVHGVSTDSRTVEPGQLFIPLAGPRFDGHDFVPMAAARGAAAALIQRGRPLPPLGDRAVIVVDDPLAALHRLARWYRDRLPARVVAVTGSNGKTTTKDMAAAILSARWATRKSEGNYNNEVGLPLAILAAPADVEALVLEMGMRGPGQIRQLAAIARPDVGVVTNVGPVHLELLGSLERIALAKQELVEALPRDGWAVLNGDDPRVRAMARRCAGQVLLYGVETGSKAPGAGLDLWASAVESRGLDGIAFTLHWQGQSARVTVPVPGRHQVYNALAAAGAALALGGDLEGVVQGLAAFAHHASAMRLEIRRRADGVRVINDAYNASPASMAAALVLLREVHGARRVAVLGDMLELGPWSEAAHEEVGRQAAEAGVDWLVAVGQWRATVIAAAVAAGLPAERTAACPDAAAAADRVAALVEPGDVVLIKASRGLALERVAQRLLGDGEEGPR